MIESLTVTRGLVSGVSYGLVETWRGLQASEDDLCSLRAEQVHLTRSALCGHTPSAPSRFFSLDVYVYACKRDECIAGRVDVTDTEDCHPLITRTALMTECGGHWFSVRQGADLAEFRQI